VPVEVFSRLLDKAAGSFPLAGVKIGVQPDAPHVERLAALLSGMGSVPVVLDPVMAAKNGLPLITPSGIEALVARLFPLGVSITPNIDEAQALTGMLIEDIDSMEQAARLISKKGPRNVFLKGGHLAGEPVDLLFDGRTVTMYSKKRVEKTVHGTGCLFSSALLAHMAEGHAAREAFMETEAFMEAVLAGSHRPSEGGYHYAFPPLHGSPEGVFLNERETRKPWTTN
jgi:hydroxymethylpyrimidine/phosphomethylpyrimidine kinase